MLFVTLVLDGVGIGAQPDAAAYGEDFCDTLGHVLAQARPRLPHLETLGLGCIRPLDGLAPPRSPLAAYGRMQEVSPGMDSTTGHWELAGLTLAHAFPTYPGGFPAALIDRFRAATGVPGVIDGGVASGTGVIADHGAAHRATGYPILYTSADSVFQIATHIDTVPLDTLYAWCETARHEVCTGEHAVGRVIARPFTGEAPFARLSAKRRDYALAPFGPTVQDHLRAAGVRTVAVGKIGDLFAGVGFDEVRKTASNAEGVAQTLGAMRDAVESGTPTFVWTNLVEFDQDFGHRNDVAGFAAALEAFDAAVPALISSLPGDGRLLLTADHGNDPTTPSTDHNREYVPLLLYGGPPRDLGLRTTFSDHAATVAAYFGVEGVAGTSFL